MEILAKKQATMVCGGYQTKAVITAVVMGYIVAGPAGAGLAFSNFVLIEGINKLTTLIETGEVT